MKRRSLTVLLCLLAIISLASVGFASWVISAGDTDQATGNIQVEQVSDKRLVISDVSLTAQDFILAGKPASPVAENWLKVSGDTTEVLTTTLSFKVAFKDGTTVVTENTGKNASITVEWDLTTLELLEGAVEAGYILAVPQLNLTGSNGAYSVTITFQWGTKFGGIAPVGEGAGTAGLNPFNFYNGKEANDAKHYVDNKGNIYDTEEAAKAAVNAEPEDEISSYTKYTWADDASTTMGALYGYFSGKQYKIEISAQPTE